VLAFDPENADATVFLAAAERSLAAAGSPVTAGGPDPNISVAPADCTAHPTSFASGRYQVRELLGEGGKKKVYLAHDTLLDRDVAFALIKTEGLDEQSRARIQREAQAMGRGKERNIPSPPTGRTSGVRGAYIGAKPRTAIIKMTCEVPPTTLASHQATTFRIAIRTGGAACPSKDSSQCPKPAEVNAALSHWLATSLTDFWPK